MPRTATNPYPPFQLYGVPDGVEGIRATLAMMGKIAREWRHRPEITEVARSIVALVPEKDQLSETVHLFAYVQNGVRYVMDTNGVERLQTPDYTLRTMQGDCDDQAILLGTLLESIGIPARFVAVGFSPDNFEHVYVEAFPIGADDWIALDPTEQEPAGWFPPGIVTRINQPI